MWNTRVCGLLNIKYPIFQGGMTMISGAELVAAVSNAGGLGTLGSNPGWVSLEKREDNLYKNIKRVQELTDKPFAVNITIHGMEELAEKLVDLALNEGVKIIVCTGGSAKLFTPKIKRAGVKSIHVVGNIKQAKSAEEAEVDIVVAEGYEAGGINSPDELTTFVLTPYIVDAVKIPVVAAGGIADARGFLAAMILGAEGVQLGSRFAATKECLAHQKYKDAVVAAKDTDTVITRRAMGLRVRSLKNLFTNQLLDMEKRGAIDEMLQFVGAGRAREGQLLGDAETGDMPIGQIAGMLKEIVLTSSVIESIIGNTDSLIKRIVELQNK